MNAGEMVITAGMLSALLLQVVKVVLRRWILKDPSYDFPVTFYGIMVPVLNAVMPFVMSYGLGMTMTDPILTMTWLGVVRYIVIVALGAAISVFTNSGVIKPIKNYAEQLEFEKQLVSGDLTK